MIEHKVVNCQEWTEDRFVPGAVSPKYDGIRGFYYPGEPTLFTRNEEPLFGFDHIIEAFKRINYDHASDMELYIEGMEFNKLSGLIRNHEPVDKAIGMIIDTPSHKGELIDRLRARPAHDLDLPIISIQHFKVTRVEQVYAYYERYKSSHEGIVFKSLNHLYKHGRPWDWMRLVPINSQDCTVLGVYEGSGKFSGAAGGLTVEWFNPTTDEFQATNVGTMKGITSQERVKMYRYPEDYVGRIAQINFKDYQVSGKPRQPRFYAWRDDKTA